MHTHYIYVVGWHLQDALRAGLGLGGGVAGDAPSRTDGAAGNSLKGTGGPHQDRIVGHPRSLACASR